jgi:hypothetical protein
LDVRNTTILENAVGSRLIHEVPRFPDALPAFTVQTTVEIALPNNQKKHYVRKAAFDLSD